MDMSVILRAFVAEWSERFGSRPVVAGKSDCLAFVADWAGDEDFSAKIHAEGLPALRERALRGREGICSAASLLGLYRVNSGDEMPGDLGWLRHNGLCDEWAGGVAGIFGGKMARLGGGTDKFWWVLREPTDAAAMPILEVNLNQPPLVFSRENRSAPQ